jgi:nicotinamidase-related amidase
MTATALATSPLRVRAGDFLDTLDTWMEALQPLSLADLISEAQGPEHIGIFCVDVIGGFCHEGPLYSTRVEGIVAPIVRLFTAAHEAGIERFVLTHDAHDPDAAEFADYPPHCVRGTRESAIVPELMALPCASRYEILPKNCISSGIGTGLDAWLDAHPEVTHRIVVGDCTDLCTYHLAMHLKLRANAFNQRLPVILPANCVDTYDLPVEVARAAGISSHPADLFHPVFLYSMAVNGVRVVSRID